MNYREEKKAGKVQMEVLGKGLNTDKARGLRGKARN
jgi:hypothetical protein